MKIHHQPAAPRTSAASNAGDPRLSGERLRAPDVSSSTQVKLSAGADLKAASSEGDFDAQKVASLKAQITNGTFRVNAEVVADKLISSNVESLSNTRRN